jgi:hypothetical protein
MPSMMLLLLNRLHSRKVGLQSVSLRVTHAILTIQSSQVHFSFVLFKLNSSLGQIDTYYVYSYDGLYGYYSYKLTSCMDGEVVTFYQSADETCSNIQNTANYTATCTSHMAYLKVIVCGVLPAPVASPVEPPS